jgi:tetratricopeptide (TPR) repeat protein
MPQPFPTNPNYLTVLRGLLDIHQLTVNGQFESPEADLVRDAMDGPWHALSDIERKRIAGLSEDLNETVEHPATHTPLPMNPQVQQKLNEAYEAREQGDWDRALGLLRRWGRYVPAALLAYLRGTIWRAAGDAATAVVFLEHACRLDPANDNYRAIWLYFLKTADPARAIPEAQKVLDENERHSPVAIVYAAEIAFGPTLKTPGPDTVRMCQQLIPILERTLAWMNTTDDVDGPALKGMVLSLLASCYEHVGDSRAAYNYYSRAIQQDPTNDALLVARGRLVYGANPQAIVDFEQAIQLGCPLVWPYFFLAHHYLGSSRFDDCRLMCERALRKPAPPRVKSELYEFLAISQAGLQYPSDVVRRTFENAFRADSANDRARRNLERFEGAVGSEAQPRDWERSSESSLRLSSPPIATAKGVVPWSESSLVASVA